MHLPNRFLGIIYDLSSVSSLHAIATAKKQAKSTFKNYSLSKLCIYTSEHSHSSIDKAIKTLGLSDSALVKIKVNDNFEMIRKDIQKAINKDI